jgi:hypothetical protein
VKVLFPEKLRAFSMFLQAAEKLTALKGHEALFYGPLIPNP